jgi:hypothetical protein
MQLQGLRVEDIGPTLLKIYGLQYENGSSIDGHVIPEVIEACK